MSDDPARKTFMVSLAALSRGILKKEEPTRKRDVCGLIVELRQDMLKNENTTDIWNISRLIQMIIQEINQLAVVEDVPERLDDTFNILYSYLKELLSIKHSTHILTSDIFQKIFSAWTDIHSSISYSSLFNNNPKQSRITFDKLFSCLALPVINDLLNDQVTAELRSHLFDIFSKILETIEITVSYTVFKKNDLEEYRGTLSQMIHYLQQHTIDHDTFIKSMIDLILRFFWNISDDTILVLDILKTDCHLLLLKWIVMGNLNIDIIIPCLHILHNLAHHEKGVQTLCEADALTVLKNFKKLRLDPNKKNEDEVFVELRLVYCMVVSLISERNETTNNIDNLEPILDQLMNLVYLSGTHDGKKYSGFHISEPLVVLTKLCLNDDILKYVFSHTAKADVEKRPIANIMAGLLIEFRGALVGDDDKDQLTLLALCNILWSVSFHDEYTEILRSNKELLKTIKCFAVSEDVRLDQYVPRHMSSITKASNGILWNLDEENPARAARNVKTSEVTSTTAADKKVDSKENAVLRVMISYAHADSTFCHQLVDELNKEKRIKIWVDFEYCHSEDLWAEIGEAIEAADVILFLMSKDYQNSKSCRQEVMYAKDSLKKRFIPIFTQKDFTATGWLGVRIVGPQYVRFGKRAFEQTVSELIKLIFDEKTTEQKPSTSETKVSTDPKKTEVAENPNKSNPTETINKENEAKLLKKPLKDWSREDVIQYLSINSVDKDLIEIYQFSDGYNFLIYGECLSPNWQAEYDDVRQRYLQKYEKILYRDDFVRLVGAVRNLQLTIDSKQKSRICTVL